MRSLGERSFLEATFGAVYEDGPGHPSLPTRLMAGLLILTHMHDLSDEALCDRWVQNPYFQCFCARSWKASRDCQWEWCFAYAFIHHD